MVGCTAQAEQHCSCPPHAASTQPARAHTHTDTPAACCCRLLFKLCFQAQAEKLLGALRRLLLGDAGNATEMKLRVLQPLQASVNAMAAAGKGGNSEAMKLAVFEFRANLAVALTEVTRVAAQPGASTDAQATLSELQGARGAVRRPLDAALSLGAIACFVHTSACPSCPPFAANNQAIICLALRARFMLLTPPLPITAFSDGLAQLVSFFFGGAPVAGQGGAASASAAPSSRAASPALRTLSGLDLSAASADEAVTALLVLAEDFLEVVRRLLLRDPATATDMKLRVLQPLQAAINSARAASTDGGAGGCAAPVEDSSFTHDHATGLQQPAFSAALTTCPHAC